MKSVAIIPPGTLPLPPVRGGAVENLIDLVRESNNREHDMHLTMFSIETPEARESAEQNTVTNYVFVKIPWVIKRIDRLTFWSAKHILHKPKPMSYRYIFQRLYYIRWIARYLSKHNFDRVVLENHATLLWVMRLYHNNLKYAGRYYYHLHNKVSNFYHCQVIFEQAAAIIGVSKYILSTLPDMVRQRAKLVVLNNRVDEHRFTRQLTSTQKDAYRKRFKLGDKKIVLFTGRFSPEKGPRELLAAWQKIRPQDAVLLIVGGEYFKSDIRTAFEKEMATRAASLKKSVRFTGFIDYQTMPDLYALADLVVLPSMWDDPAPLTVIEALTAGKQLITTDSGGIPEYTTSDTIVLKRDNKLVDNLAKAIQETLTKSINSHPKKNDWHFSDYYQHFLQILQIK